MNNNNRHSWRQDAREQDSKDFNGYLTTNNMDKSVFQSKLEEQMKNRNSFNNQFNRAQKKINRGISFGTIFVLIMIICWFANLYKLTQCNVRSMDNPTIIHAIGIIPYAGIVTVWFPVSEKNNIKNIH